MPTAANDLCLVQINSTHYFLAGGESTSSGDRLATVNLFSPETGLWQEMPAMPRARSGHLCGVKGHKVYVFGGGDAETWVLDLETLVWSRGIRMPIWQTATASVQFNGTFVVLDMKPTKK